MQLSVIGADCTLVYIWSGDVYTSFQKNLKVSNSHSYIPFPSQCRHGVLFIGPVYINNHTTNALDEKNMCSKYVYGMLENHLGENKGFDVNCVSEYSVYSGPGFKGLDHLDRNASYWQKMLYRNLCIECLIQTTTPCTINLYVCIVKIPQSIHSIDSRHMQQR